jgi:hypothetical protein
MMAVSLGSPRLLSLRDTDCTYACRSISVINQISLNYCYRVLGHLCAGLALRSKARSGRRVDTHTVFRTI